MSDIRELAMRLAMENGFMLSTMHGQDTLKAMPVTDADTAEALVRAAMREGMVMAANIAGSLAEGPYDSEPEFSVATSIEASIRAEAAKLEGKG